MSLRWPPKDPDETLDYSIDWSRFLGSNTITTVRWYLYDASGTKIEVSTNQTVDGLTAGPRAATGTVATLVLIGGTLNKVYRVVCSIEFGSGLIAERTATISIRNN
jgi:hypothetical protein